MMKVFSKKSVSEMFNIPPSEEDVRRANTTRTVAGEAISFAKAAAMARMQGAQVEAHRGKSDSKPSSRLGNKINAPKESEERYPGELFPNWRFD